MTRNSYDEFPYPSKPFAQTHIRRLAVLADLHNLSPAPDYNCRVLELGCSDGGNLIPMCIEFPDSRFVGIDLSEVQIEQGRRLVKKLSLSNIDLMRQDILNIDSSLGKFDYIIAHGVYSWVKEEVRNKIMMVCRDHLNPSGVAFISYNILPGWSMLRSFREMMLYYSKDYEDKDVEKKAEKALSWINFLSNALGDADNYYCQALKWAKDVIGVGGERSLSYFIHEYLEEVNDPLYFHQFVEKAAEFDLQFVADSDPGYMNLDNFEEKENSYLRQLGGDRIQLEQYYDFVYNRMFRQTLLCHSRHKLFRGYNFDKFDDYFIASRLEPGSKEPNLFSSESESFIIPTEKTRSLQTNDPFIKTAFYILKDYWPQSLNFKKLTAKTRKFLNRDKKVCLKTPEEIKGEEARLKETLWKAFASALITLCLTPYSFTTEVSDYPEASPLARYQVESNNIFSNMLHEICFLKDEVTRLILKNLDGSKNHSDLLEILIENVKKGKLSLLEDGAEVKAEKLMRTVLKQELEEYLERIARDATLLS